MKPQLKLVESQQAVPTLKAWRDDFLVDKGSKLEDSTLRNYRLAINLYIAFVGESHWPPTRPDIIRFLTDVRQRASQSTVHSYWSVLRGWLNYMALLGAFGHMPNPAEQIRQLKLAPKNPKSKPKGIPEKHVESLLEYLQTLPRTINSQRDWTLIYFLYRTGARAGEASTLTTMILQVELNRMCVEADIAKDDEDRNLYFGKKVRAALNKWLSMLDGSGYNGDWVFPSTRGGRIIDRPLRVDGIYQMVQRRLVQAGLPMYRTHDLRHTFTKTAIRQKISLSSLQKQLGHASPDMVLRYAKAFNQDQERDFITFGDDE